MIKISKKKNDFEAAIFLHWYLIRQLYGTSLMCCKNSFVSINLLQQSKSYYLFSCQLSYSWTLQDWNLWGQLFSMTKFGYYSYDFNLKVSLHNENDKPCYFHFEIYGKVKIQVKICSKSRSQNCEPGTNTPNCQARYNFRRTQ